MATIVKISLPLPHKTLHPNHHHRTPGGAIAKHIAYQAYKERACIEATAIRLQNQQQGFPWSRAMTHARFFFATNRNRDGDNLGGWLKAGWDGIAQGGLVVNDSGLTHMPPMQDIDKDNPRVELTIEETP